MIALLLGMPVAVASALWPGSWLDRILSGMERPRPRRPDLLARNPAHPALRGGAALAALGLGLRAVLGIPAPDAAQHRPSGADARGLRLRHLRALPARLARRRAQADYVRTARSKGLRERDIVGRHVLRNALLPFVTIVGLMMANFIGGTVVTEAVFTYPGLGRLLITAISTRDYPLIQGCILVILVIYVVINMMVDVLYAYIDPRIEYA